MAYSVSNSEEVERAAATAREQTVDTTMRDGTVETHPIAAFRRGVSDTLVAALDELQAKVDEQAACIEQFERSYSQIMRQLDELEAEANHG